MDLPDLSLTRLSKRPFRALPSGILPVFPSARSATAVRWSVPAFLLGKTSVGAPLLRQCSRQSASPVVEG